MIPKIKRSLSVYGFTKDQQKIILKIIASTVLNSSNQPKDFLEKKWTKIYNDTF